MPHYVMAYALPMDFSTLFERLGSHRASFLLAKNDSALAKPSWRPGPKGPSKEVIDAIVAMKQRNPRYGCPRIAQQINVAFGLHIDKDIVRRILAQHYRPVPRDNGPSWLTTLGHAKDSLWSMDLFRCESILLKSHRMLLVMDQFTRRIIGFAVHDGDIEVLLYADYLIVLFSSKSHRNTLVRITIPFFYFIGGGQTSVY